MKPDAICGKSLCYKIVAIRESCKDLTSHSLRRYIQTGQARWLIMEACGHSCRVVNAPIVPCAFSMRVEREHNINSKFSWGYPVSRSAMVSSLCNRGSITSILKPNDFFRELHISNGWTRLHNPRLESVCSREGECCSVRTSFDYLRACHNRCRQAHLFSIERQMHKSVGRPSP